MGRIGAALGVAAAVVVYRRVVQPWQEQWGATAEERVAALPGDDAVAEPATQLTRAIGIAAPPEAVWPWIVQIGADRGGFYSYDLLENLFGLDIHSADEVVEEWQDLGVGDLVYGDRKRRGGWVVVDAVPGEVLVLQVADVESRRPVERTESLGWEFSWTFALRADGSGGTRLLVRERVAFGRAAARWMMAPVGVVSFVMTRRMLLGIRERVESAAVATASR